MSRTYFSKRLIEFLPLSAEKAVSLTEIQNYVMAHEEWATKNQLNHWLRYYSKKPNSILTKIEYESKYFLKTKKQRHKIYDHEIIPKTKKVYRKIEDFSARNRKIIRLYKKGLTLQEIGDEHGLTRERVRQILLPAKKLGLLKTRLAKPRVTSLAGLKSMKEKGISRRGKNQKFKERNEKIVQLVSLGHSATEVGKMIGVSRSTVCALMYRVKRYDGDL